ncbi:toprim domain-containing protein [Flavobacterium sp. TR2]|uniref:toprim domain-containing protein n=1 Tax=Flavobacterium sp. TR2 TaxID=2977321 RepID=UPI0021B12D60|nr:toprim domain-containing protein [Flavobacterium sp. TR2]UWY29363.1 toprim domain-containing protein [Flavobacterium sp. TR2]
MNAIQAKEISIEKILQNLGCEPTKSNQNESWYLSPFRIEKTASFKLNRKINRWFDHGEQKGGNVIDFVIAKFGFNVSEALSYLEKFDSFFSFHEQIFNSEAQEENTINVEKIMPIQHVALIQYLKSRGIKEYKTNDCLKEIHYTIKDKKYFAIGFENKSNGFEIRNKYAKICIGKKDVTLVSNQSQILRIFEGFFDYLSFIQIRDNKNLEQSDYLVLNSVGLITKNLSVLQNYRTIELYLDNDTTGNKYTELIIKSFQDSIDYRRIFKGYKDLNEWFSLCEIEVKF